MKNVLAVSIALVPLPVLVQAADITEAPSTTNAKLCRTLRPNYFLDLRIMYIMLNLVHKKRQRYPWSRSWPS